MFDSIHMFANFSKELCVSYNAYENNGRHMFELIGLNSKMYAINL